MSKILHKPYLLWLPCWLFFTSFAALAQVSVITLSPELTADIRAQHGRRASNRVVRWDEFIRENQNREVLPVLGRVNKFFNRIPFGDDQPNWHQDDYWSTPIEFLISNAGDCEDYAIAKYFTLRALGVPDSVLRLIYVTKAENNEPHMVLTYFDQNLEQLLVLDSLMSDIKPASERTDLTAVYSFNSESLWHAKEIGQEVLLGSPESLLQWSAMLLRLPSS